MKEQLDLIQQMVVAKVAPATVAVLALDLAALMVSRIEELEAELNRIKEFGSKSKTGGSNGGFSIG